MPLAGWALAACDSSDEADVEAVDLTGWRMPTEEDEHERTWMSWPHRPAIYGGIGVLDSVRQDVTGIALAVAHFEPVVMAVDPADLKDARTELGSDVEFLEIPVDDLWMRDTGPLFVVGPDGELGARGLNFNGWGNKQVHEADAEIAERVADAAGVPFQAAGLVGEGGALEIDGAGTLLAAESSWVNDNRNPGMDREAVEAELGTALGTEHFVWTEGLVEKDITDYHIDAIARFVRPGVLFVETPPAASDDIWARTADAVLADMEDARTIDGEPFEIHTVAEPATVRVDSPDFVNSYANYYVANSCAIAASFGDEPADRAAAEKLEELFPGREIVTIDIDSLATYGGGIHCATQQQPAV